VHQRSTVKRIGEEARRPWDESDGIGVERLKGILMIVGECHGVK